MIRTSEIWVRVVSIEFEIVSTVETGAYVKILLCKDGVRIIEPPESWEHAPNGIYVSKGNKLSLKMNDKSKTKMKVKITTL